MSRFFTSDWHVNSENIIKYANRPFANASDMLMHFMKTCNYDLKLTCEDTLIHAGDLILVGHDRHDKNLGEDNGGKTLTAKSVVAGIFANMILLNGNHDSGHNCDTIANSMTIDLNQNYRNVYVSHYPSDHKFYCGPTRFGAHGIHIVLCGHVHDKWLLKYDSVRRVLNVNVGVDVWNYRPVRDAEITELLDYFKATMWTKINPAPGKWTNFALTREALDEFKIAHSEEVKKAREQRKQEKYEQKGLTPEERERRRAEAMRAKGLDPDRKRPKKKEESKFTHEDAVQFGVVPPDTTDVLFDSWNDV